MTIFTKHKILVFQESLITWYKENGRVFPWRKSNVTVYELVISEVLLQRTKADTISKFLPVFLLKYPSWKSICNSSIISLEKTLQSIGLNNQRAQRLFGLARKMNLRGGRVPKNPDEFMEIPQIGHYISNAILCAKFNFSLPMLDVNMARFLERYFGPRKLADIRYDPYLYDLSRKIVVTSSPKTINWAILDYAAIICKPRNPACNICLIQRNCHEMISSAQD